ncbi:uncharacterized protein [Rutidosis leptorrhynchoides]|uniref:uncharacterized protein n=1 Tax=Rutidosis leptorrhynchoides TaxID=125765 RepID=UPI003A992CDB
MGPSNFESIRNSLVPSKVEVFVWRARKRRIAVLAELDKRGVDLHSVLCPICNQDVETVDHSLVLCSLAFDIWEQVFKWWGLGNFSNLSIGEIFLGNLSIHITDLGKKIWQEVEWTCGYLIWKNHNHKVSRTSIGMRQLL